MRAADLIRAMAAGDRHAFARFYDRYAPLVYPMIARTVRDEAAADVLQEVLWDSWQDAPTYDPARRSPEAWLFTRARARALDRVRAAGRRGETNVEPHDAFDALAERAGRAALDGEELGRFETHVAEGCARCDATVRQTEETLARAAMGGPPKPPPPEVRGTLLRRVGASRRPGPVRWLPWAIGTAVAAVGAAALAGGYVAARYEARLGELARKQVRAKEALAEQALLSRSVVELLSNPGTRVVELRGQPAASAAVGRLVWHDANGGLLFVAKLPPPAAGKAYALWTIAGGVPRPAGMFAPDTGGRATVTVPPAPGGGPASIFAVTLEPEGGVKTPTGPMVLASTR